VPLAYRATQYLQELLDNDAIVPEESEPLDAIFKEFSLSESSSPTEDPLKTTSTNNGIHELVLRREAVPSIVSLFSLKKSADADLYRAIEQARLRIGSGQTEA
jgi:hypothetical protein